MTTIKEKIEVCERNVRRSRMRLLNKEPFFGYLSMKMKPVPDIEGKVTKPEMPVVIFGDGKLLYNVDYVSKADDGTLDCAMTHMILHSALHHIRRGRGKKKDKWSIACDLSIALAMHNEGHGHFDNNRFLRMSMMPLAISDMTAEQIYEKLPPMVEDNDEYGKPFDSMSFGKDDGTPEPADGGTMEGFEKDDLGQAMMFAAGKNAGDKNFLLELVLKQLDMGQKVNWRAMLYRYIEQTMCFDFTYSKPSKRSFGSGYILPAMRRENLEMIIGIDSSSSVNNEKLAVFLGEALSVLNSFDNLKVKFAFFDTKIAKVVEYENGMDVKDVMSTRYCSGGTDFKAVVDFAEEERAKVLVMFTDLQGHCPLECSVPTLWVCQDGDAAAFTGIHFGELATMDE